MNHYWQSLTFSQKVKMISWGVAGLLILIFAGLNWQSVELHVLVSSFQIPLVILIVLCILIGYGYARIFGASANRKKDEEIKALKQELAAMNAPLSNSSQSKGGEENASTNEAG